MKECRLCPRECGVNRLAGETGYCGAGVLAKVHAHGPHHGEEPQISGSRGAGTIFFSNCTMKCLYCQNYPFSLMGEGKEIFPEELARIMVLLQEEGCHNIELVSPTHYLPQILAALLIATERGLALPLVYNTNGYERLETLWLINGLVDIYLPDYKYGRDEEAFEFSQANSYTRFARAAIIEMFRQAGNLRTENGIARRGLIIRHLVLPSNCDCLEEALRWIAESFPADAAVSLMGQYIPLHRAPDHPRLMRRTTEQEMENALELAMELGLTNVLYQAGLSEKDVLVYRGDRIKESIQRAECKVKNENHRVH